ncbi:heme NO-binding domain-containing protein [Kitasatospora sp. NPDC048540]|uniref:heme NO-binding domain-containing protein n=1 Tax=unclassified Kitasatospora TaxID=2633591 RepID=UPI00053A5B53|nr:heme NO-binding domain-containing protein [Kitasatospora sp. MBT63]
MKGLWIWAFEEAVNGRYGERVWDSMLETAGMDGVYTPMGNYPPEDLLRLGEAGAEVVGRPAAELLDWQGTEAVGLIAERYPYFVESHHSPQSLIRAIDSFIDPGFWRHHNPYVPVFDFEQAAPDRLSVLYRPRPSAILCATIGGAIKGMVLVFGEEPDVRQSSCMWDGAGHCVFEVGLGRR